MEKIPPTFIEDCLEAHNQYRAIHGAPPLVIDEKLNEYAQERVDSWAQNALPSKLASQDYGENLYVASPRPANRKLRPEESVDFWYQEGKYYRYGVARPGNFENVKNFSQVVWKSTKSMGLGLAKCSVDGKIYLVCNYQPAGNLDAEFAENVLPPVEDDVEPPPLEEVGIKYIEPQVDCVESMERLYAVPSEMLRVWSVWITKTGEVAVEWQKWLHANIDLYLALADRLRLAEYAINQAKEGTDDAVSKGAVSKDSYLTVENEMQETEQTDRASEEPSEEDAPANIDSVQTTDAQPVPEEVQSDPKVDEEAAESNKDERTKSMEQDSEESISGDSGWPIGRRWRPIPVREKKLEDRTIQVPFPRNVAEMERFKKDFTYQATLYRSYYKHWQETACQATKEIGNRTVMSTLKLRGSSALASPSRAPLPSLSIPSGGKAASVSGNQLKQDEPSELFVSARSTLDSDQEDSESEQIQQVEVNELDESVPADGNDTFQKDRDTVRSMDKSSPVESRDQRMSGKSIEKPSKGELGVEATGKKEEAARDMARAEEDIPYFFYVRTEPDIDIAIEHDDEEVIPADPNRESIAGNYNRLYFNLTDKPGKGGKPWL